MKLGNLNIHDTLLAAVSGGRDSVVLAELLHRQGFRFEIAHCNFHLRGDESDRDEAFVHSLAERLGVPCHVAQFDTERYAREHGLSVEMAARELRYSFFEQTRRERGLDLIAVAHHRDDSVETFFLNLLRGTGVAGLGGIKPLNGHIVRPLLPFSREEIDRFVEEEKLQYVEDHTNATLLFQRNRIRHQLLPLLRELSPSFDHTMETNMSHLADASAIVDLYVDTLRQRAVTQRPDGIIAIALAEVGEPRETLLFELLRPYNFAPSTVHDLADGLGGESGRLFLSRTHKMVRDRETLQIVPLDAPDTPPSYTTTLLPRHELQSLRCDSNFILCDPAKLRQPLTLRHWREGDRFQPFGMRGSRLLSDYWNDLKLSLLEKERAWLLCDRDGSIVWVIGMRADGRWAVDDTTTEVLRIEISR